MPYVLRCCVGVFVFFLFGCVSNSKQAPTIQNGTLDLSDWSFSDNPTLTLQGETLFYWQQWPLDDQGTFTPSALKKADTIAWPAAVWSQNEYGPKGYGTFRFYIKQKDIETSKVLNIARTLGAVELWANGKKIATHGQISKDEDKEEVDGRPLRVDLPTDAALDVMLVVSNHKNRLGGGFPLRNAIQEKTHFVRKSTPKPLIEGFITFLIVFFGIYHILKYLSFSRYDYFLYFGLYCLIGASRQLFVGEGLVYYFFPDISFEVVQKMRYIGYYGGLAFIFLYHHTLFPGYYSSRFVYFLTSIPIVGTLYVLFTPAFYGTYSAPFFQVFGLVVILLGLYQIGSAAKDKKPYALVMLISMSVTCLMLVNDLLNAMLVIQTEYVINYGMLFYLGFQMFLNHKIQQQRERERELQLAQMSSDIEHMRDDISTKEEEITKLRSETFQQLKSKEKLVENLKKVASNDETVSIQSLITELRSELVEDSKLALIKNDIEALNHEFAERLKKQHPNLTKTDLEICSYLRMSLGRKEIARLRFTSLEAVKKSRSRLRKKLNLSQEVDLEEYLQSI